MPDLLGNVLSFLENFDFLSLLFRIISIVLALTIHEMSHAYTAYRLGDSTAKYGGRISLNPLRHIDVMGFLALIFIGFGWAKPVMMNPYNFRNYRDGVALTALAGPLSNFLMAIISAFLLKLPMPELLWMFLLQFMMINIVLAAFNILPIPPLDGYKVFTRVLPNELYYRAEYVERRYGMWILLGFLLTGIIYSLFLPVILTLTALVNYLTFSSFTIF